MQLYSKQYSWMVFLLFPLVKRSVLGWKESFGRVKFLRWFSFISVGRL